MHPASQHPSQTHSQPCEFTKDPQGLIPLLTSSGPIEARAAFNASGYFMVGGNIGTPGGGTVILVAGTSNVVAGNVSGKLGLLGGNSVILCNNLSAAVDVVMTVFWS